MKTKIIATLANKRYAKLSPSEIANYFTKLSPSDRAVATEEILKNNNLVAKEKILEYIKSELNPIFDQYYITGSIPTTIVEELFS